MAKGKTKGAGVSLPVPQNDAEAEQMIARMGALSLDFEAEKAKHVEIVAEHGRKIAELNEAFAKVEDTFNEANKQIFEGLKTFAAANRQRLTADGKTKTVRFATGSMSWKEGSFAVRSPRKNDDLVALIEARCQVISALLDEAKAKRRRNDVELHSATLMKLHAFLRTKVEPNKDAMLADRELASTVPGISITRGPEEFFVEPLAAQIREVA